MSAHHGNLAQALTSEFTGTPPSPKLTSQTPSSPSPSTSTSTSKDQTMTPTVSDLYSTKTPSKPLQLPTTLEHTHATKQSTATTPLSQFTSSVAVPASATAMKIPQNPDQDLNLAVIGNCTFNALIDNKGSVVWCCMPRFDGDPVFCSLLRKNKDIGFFDVELLGHVRSEQAYIKNTAILRTVLHDSAGNSLDMVDFCPRYLHLHRSFKPTVMVRMLTPRGRPRIRVRLRPTFGYGWGVPEKTRGSNHIRYLMPTATLRLTSNAPIAYLLREVAFEVDEPIFLILMPDESLSTSIDEFSLSNFDKTKEYWQDWVSYLSLPFEWQSRVIRACITLKLLTYEETGALISSITTSIPTSPGPLGVRKDDRYCRLQDMPFMMRTMNRLGIAHTMSQYLRFISNIICNSVTGDTMVEAAATRPVAHGDMGSHGFQHGSESGGTSVTTTITGDLSKPIAKMWDAAGMTPIENSSPMNDQGGRGVVNLLPLYGIGLETALHQREVHRLSGYRMLGPVVVGNQEYKEFSTDVYGATILANSQIFFDKRLNVSGEAQLFERLESLGDRILELYAKPSYLPADMGPEFPWFGDDKTGGAATGKTGDAKGKGKGKGKKHAVSEKPHVDSMLAVSAGPHKEKYHLHIYGVLMCWAGLDRLAKISNVFGRPDREEHWQKAAQQLREFIMSKFWDETNQFFRSVPGGPISAHVLLLPEVGFLQPDDPIFLATLKQVDLQLRSPDHQFILSHPRHTGNCTTLYTIWYINALIGAGRSAEARQLFEFVLSCCNVSGTLSETIDPITRELWGNYPHSMSTITLVYTAIRLSIPWRNMV